jgi:PAS domain S-box-containing protein
MIVMTLDGNVVQWDAGAEALFGHASAEVVGHSIFELIVLSDQADGERQPIEVTVEDCSSTYECIYRREDGSMFYADSSSRVFRAIRGPGRDLSSRARRVLLSPPWPVK